MTMLDTPDAAQASAPPMARPSPLAAAPLPDEECYFRDFMRRRRRVLD